MQHLFIDYVYLILAILALVMLANKIRLAYPIMLVLGGLALSFIPEFANIEIEPELVFLLFLPPLLYESAWNVSWKEFWKWRRVITSFAFIIVILTSCVIAFVSVSLIPGFTLALGFLLGGIVSPPDAISATTIMRRVNVPRSLVSIAEGESLLNDASSLIVFRFAVAAILTSQFHIEDAAANFVVVVTMGILIGLGVGLLVYCIHRWLPVTTGIEIVLTLITPYCMYYAAEHFHFSGVLAVVSGGLFLSYHRRSMLTYASRIQSVNVWSSLVFVLNGLVFLLIGLQLPVITGQLEDVSTATWYGLAISATLIVTRMLCTIGASYFSMFMSRFITVANPNPGWKSPVILGWAGMRGVVSLAAALSIPLMITNYEIFPYRNLIIYITFIVILVTLVLQGLTLPWLVKMLNIGNEDNTRPEWEQEQIIQKKMARHALNYLEEKHSGKHLQNQHLNNLRSRLELEFGFFNQSLEGKDETSEQTRTEYHSIYLELLEQQRDILDNINHHAEFDEELIRKYLMLIDLEEFKLRG